VWERLCQPEFPWTGIYDGPPKIDQTSGSRVSLNPLPEETLPLINCSHASNNSFKVLENYVERLCIRNETNK